MRIDELIVYKDFGNDSLLEDMAYLMDHYKDCEEDKDYLRSLAFDCIHRLLEMGGNHGFSGNLWHCYLTNLLVNNENTYSRSTEIRGQINGTVNDAVLHDIVIFKELYDYDFTDMTDALSLDAMKLVFDYKASTEESKVYNDRIRRRICDLAETFHNDNTPTQMKDSLTQFYREYGVGRFGLHKAFRVSHGTDDEVNIVPILNIAHVKLDDLVGYDIAKQKLIENTEAFVSGRRANNCLLYGDAGTGKSSSIKAIANMYYDRGLRIIEIYKHQFKDLNDVIAQIKNRNYKFIIYMDDLSFEEFEVEYKYLKAVIEGGLEKKPKNVLIYATSNRRHLVNERFSDRDDALHKSDTMQEKLSLVSRFGCTIYFGLPEKKEYQEIVLELAGREGIDMDKEELLLEANKWEVAHGGRSGRCARQFIDYLLGREQTT
ncbi:MAG: ATP-binding protein [Lachnospiraceae bacterium]|nr:ATP-binding protein [Lachnospiraceae bacterium]MDY4999505.1 ATP-binding protein [Lachnospiraceae bacterium]